MKDNITQTEKAIKFPIDLVYLWVDGNDPVWREKRNAVNTALGNDSRNNEARWRDNDELKYSLRSVEKYAPWINRIFIVTDNQCPRWLDTGNPKVQIIDHSQIFPADALPIFNSQAIESVIYKIPGLSEHFILGNDDTLFSMPVSPLDFFNSDGTTIVRLSGARMRDSKARKGDMYVKTVYRMRDLVYRRFGVKIHYRPHHNFDSYRVGDFKRCAGLFKEEWTATIYSRFRSEEDIQRYIVGYYVIATGQGIMKRVGRYNRLPGIVEKITAFFGNRFASDSRCIPADKRDYMKVMKKYNPMMFCINDGEKTTDKDRERIVDFLEALFPHKSVFEK